jgi:MscS family membrane protein
MSRLTVSVIWLALFILIWSLLNNLSSRGEQILREKNRVAGVSLIIFFKAIVKSILILVAIILILDNYGVDVTTGIAALGLGGIAIALGAQKAIENIVGSITIIVDQPFRVGDFCKMGELLGTVEHIGLRSTRIRTLSDTLVTFPNGELSTAEIENFTLRKKFLLRTTLNLRYETSSENMQEILSQLRKLLKNAKDVINDGIRVNFIAYGAASKDVEVFAYIRAADYAMFLAKQESVLLSMSKIVEGNGSGFAFPSQTLYLSRDTAPSE